MAKDRIDLVEERVRNIERRLDLLDYRMRSVEAWRAGSRFSEAQVFTPSSVPMQPVMAPEPPPIIREPLPPTAITQPPMPTARERTEDAEYMIGAKVLPKIGAGVVLLAVVYFVQLGYNNGWITPWMIFWAATVFCVAFIGIGQWKRNEQEQYGQILTGIGSCGLYVTLAAGHLAQHLFSGEVLVGAFTALSLVNLGYGLWANSRAFLAIGVLGGFVAATMPIDRHQYAMDAILHMAIAVPAALIAGRRRWADMAAWLWLFSTVALIPLLVSSADWQLRVAMLYASSLVAAGAYAFAHERNSFDPQGLLAPIFLFVSALIGFSIQDHSLGAVHLLVLGAGVSALTMLCGPERRPVFFATAVAIPATIAPFCFTPVTCVGAFVILSMLASALSLWRMRWSHFFAVTEFALGGGKYVAMLALTGFPQTAEAWLLVGLAASVIASAWSAVRAGAGAESFTMAAMALTLPILGRLGVVMLGHTSLAPTIELAVAETFVAFALAAVAIAATTKWMSAVIAMWTAFVIAGLAYLAAALDAPAAGFDATLVAALAVTALVGLPVALSTAPIDMRKSISGVAGVIVGLLLMRFTYVIAPGFGLIAIESAGSIAALYAIGASITSMARRSDAAASIAWTMFAASALVYLHTIQSVLALRNEFILITALLTAFVTASIATRRYAQDTAELWHVIALLGWVLVSRWVDVSLTWAGADLRNLSTVTVAWILYALLLLGIGFWLRARELRYWSFAVMFATTLKILAIDLSSTPIPVRVAVLLGLGLLMLGGGYWYIKGRNTGAPA